MAVDPRPRGREAVVARSSRVPRKPGDGQTTAARTPRAHATRANAPRGRGFERQGAASPVSASAQLEPEPPRSSEPILIPKLRIDFVDFPYLH